MTSQSIYHICTRTSWVDQYDSSEYRHDSLILEKFIHCSRLEQIEGVLSRYFQGIHDLLILTIDTNKITPTLKFEKAPNGEMFPHIYGAINKDAIISIEEVIKKNQYGQS